MILDGKIPSGPLHEKWDKRLAEMKLVNPANKRKYRIIVIGTGLAGASAAASLGELGYTVDVFCFQDSPRRAHSISAQGGINAAKNYPNDGDSIERLFYDTIKGGDFRSREANVYRLAQLSANIIDQCVAQGVPFARDYAGYLTTRSFGGAQVSRTFYARGQTGQQLLLGAYGALSRQIRAGTVTLHPRTEMLDLVVVNGEAKGITVRDLVSGRIDSYAADAVCLCIRRLCQCLLPHDELRHVGRQLPRTARTRKARSSRTPASPRSTRPASRSRASTRQSSRSCPSPSGTTAGSGCRRAKATSGPSNDIPEAERDYYLERKYPAFGNLAARDVTSRAAKEVCDEGRGSVPAAAACILILPMPSNAWARKRSASATGTSSRCTNGSPPKTPTNSRCASTPRRTMPWAVSGWTTTWKATSADCSCSGEANFSDHGANRLGASALMQGLADGYFILPYTIANHLAERKPGSITIDAPEFRKSREDVEAFTKKLLSIKGKKSVS